MWELVAGWVRWKVIVKSVKVNCGNKVKGKRGNPERVKGELLVNGGREQEIR